MKDGDGTEGKGVQVESMRRQKEEDIKNVLQKVDESAG